MKRMNIVILLAALMLLITGCSNENEVVAEPTVESTTEETTVLAELAEEAQKAKVLSSDYYPMDRAMINCFKGKNFDVNITEWRYIGEDTIYILDKEGREFIADKANVTFFSSPLN